MVFCILILGLARAQVIDVAANLTEKSNMFCWWSTSLRNQVCACVCPSSAHALCKVLLLFRISWMLGKASRFMFFYPLAHSLPPLTRKTAPSIIFKWVAERKRRSCWWKLKKYVFDLEFGLQLCMHTVDNTFFADWYFIQRRQHVAETFGRNDTCVSHCSRYESVVWLPCKSQLLSWVKGASPLLLESAIIFYCCYCFLAQALYFSVQNKTVLGFSCCKSWPIYDVTVATLLKKCECKI